MRIAGLEPSKAITGVVVIPRGDDPPLRLTVRGLPVGFEEKISEIFSPPQAPEKPVPAGKPAKKGAAPVFLRDPESGRIVLRPDTRDPDYIRDLRQSNRGQAAFIAYHGLSADPNVKFDADPAVLTTDPSAFYSGVYGELERSGLSGGDLVLILQRVLELSNLDPKAIQRVREDFLSADSTAP